MFKNIFCHWDSEVAMPYSPTHKERTRAKVVECARILFNRHGFDGVTIDMVMEQAELTRGGFYYHFKSKEELFAAHGGGRKQGSITRIPPAKMPPTCCPAICRMNTLGMWTANVR